MSVNAVPQSPFRKNLKFIVLGLIILVSLASVIYIIYSSLWSAAKKDAEQVAVNLLKSISPPGSTLEIQNWSGSNGESLECYTGFSSALYGSNLELTEVVKYYRNNFSQRGWPVLPREIDNIFGEEEKKLGIEEADILIMGTGNNGIDYIIEVKMCRSNYCSNVPYPQDGNDLAQSAKKKYETVYWLSIIYKPENVRNNMCGCCDGS